MIIKCDRCNIDFNRKPCKIKISSKHYCSNKCKSEGQRVSLGKPALKRTPIIYDKEKVVIRTEDESKRKLLNSARQRSRERGIPLNLEFDDLPNIPEYCPILGIKINLNNIINSKNSPSLDRIIPELGYTVGNVRFISNRANNLKNNATIEELRLIYEDALKIKKEINNEQ